MIIINKPQPNISIHGTPRFKGHYTAYTALTVSRMSVRLRKVSDIRELTELFT